VVYKAGKWHGILATWSTDGKKEFWCNYANDEPNGWCCLFKDDVLTAVLEYSRGEVVAVHLIAANRVAKSFSDVDQASADAIAGSVLREIDAIEQRLKAEDDTFQERVKQVAQRWLGDIQKEKQRRQLQRIKQREMEQQRAIEEMRRRAQGGR
jgi:hypothetical protein